MTERSKAKEERECRKNGYMTYIKELTAFNKSNMDEEMKKNVQGRMTSSAHEEAVKKASPLERDNIRKAIEKEQEEKEQNEMALKVHDQNVIRVRQEVNRKRP